VKQDGVHDRRRGDPRYREARAWQKMEDITWGEQTRESLADVWEDIRHIVRLACGDRKKATE